LFYRQQLFSSQNGIADAMVTSTLSHDKAGTDPKEVPMREQPVRLGPREQQIVELLLQGCDNAEIAQQLKMARRTVKAHFNRLFLRFGITGGIKRGKLATLLYRRQLCSGTNVTEHAPQMNVNAESSSLSHKA
jgi:DNA-binding NarL/FixJ family response regulator